MGWKWQQWESVGLVEWWKLVRGLIKQYVSPEVVGTVVKADLNLQREQKKIKITILMYVAWDPCWFACFDPDSSTIHCRE